MEPFAVQGGVEGIQSIALFSYVVLTISQESSQAFILKDEGWAVSV